jgi:hypothetical protein
LIGARWYDPEIGRFISVDPAEDGENWYGYCGGDPVNWVDPDGKMPRSLAIGIAAHLMIETAFMKSSLPGKKYVEFYFPVGRADILYDNGIFAEVGEIKPDSYIKDRKRNYLGKWQLISYLGGVSKHLKKPALPLVSWRPQTTLSIPSLGMFFSVFTITSDPGMIYYSYSYRANTFENWKVIIPILWAAWRAAREMKKSIDSFVDELMHLPPCPCPNRNWDDNRPLYPPLIPIPGPGGIPIPAT